MVRGNNGAPGIDKITLAAVEEHGVTRLLDELAGELREGRYHCRRLAPHPPRRLHRLHLQKTCGTCLPLATLYRQAQAPLEVFCQHGGR